MRCRALFALAALVVSCHRAPTQWPDGPPSHLEISIGGGLDGHDTASYRGGGVVHCALGNRATFEPGQVAPTEFDVTPSKAEWALFYQHMAAAHVVEWRRRYEPDQAVHDGTQWKLALTAADARVDSSGSNAYPPRAQFDAAFAALRELVHRDHAFY